MLSSRASSLKRQRLAKVVPVILKMEPTPDAPEATKLNSTIPIDPPPPTYDNLFPPAPGDNDGVDCGRACEGYFCSCCVYLRILVIASIIFGIFCSIEYANHDGPYALIAWILTPILYIGYLLETFCYNSTHKYLDEIHPCSDIRGHIVTMHQTRPTIVFRMECYHMETRTRTVSYQQNGRTHYRTEHYTVKVTTWTGSELFVYERWWDASAPLPCINEFRRTRIQFKKDYEFANSDTEASFLNQQTLFVNANKWRDAHHNISSDFSIDGFVGESLAMDAEDSIPWYLEKSFYVLAVLVLLEIPFSFYMKKKCPKVQHRYVKVVECSAPVLA